MITGLYAAIAAIILVYFSIRVIGIRRRDKVSVGTGGNAALERAVRVHGNFVEYAAFTLLLLAIAEINNLAGPVVHAIGVAFLIGRLLHFIGFRSPEAPGVFRVVGMATTFTVLLALACIVFYQYFAMRLIAA
jgi:uncharacterized membrane protein YecN with MAPEG domain